MGASVSVSDDGSTFIFGGPFDNSEDLTNTGAGWVFGLPLPPSPSPTSNPYTQVGSRLIQPYAGGIMGFEKASSISGNGLTIAFGAPDANSSNGLVFLYSKSGNTVTFTRALAPTDGSGSGQQFGAAVALNLLGNVLVVGSPSDTDTGGEGYVYVFDKRGSTWSQTARIRPTDDSGFSRVFGKSVAVSGNGNVMVAGSGSSNFIGAVSRDFIFIKMCGNI
jgi:hypothetical protein